MRDLNHIDKRVERHYDNDYFSGNKDAMFICSEVLDILDKYKAESEEQI